MEIAWPFLVVSTDKQSETLPHQLAWATETATQKGWRLDRIGDFQDVSSGKSGPRKLVRHLLREIEALPASDRPAWVLMLRLDRVGRGSIIESQLVVHHLKQLGVRVWTRDQGEIKLDSAMEQLMVAMQSAVATHENEVRSEKATAAYHRKRKAGEHYGGIPYGMKREGGKLVPRETQAAMVLDFFRLRRDGWGYEKLARYARKTAPPKVTTRGHREMVWTTGTMHRLLANASYRGTVVPDDLFDAVQGLRGTGTREQAKYEYPLRGAVRCTCGALLSPMMGGTGKWRVRYYVCRNSVHEKYPYHNADHLEAEFVRILRRLEADARMLEGDVDSEALEQRSALLRAAMAENDKRRLRAWELAEEGGMSSVDLTQRINDLRADRDDVQAQLESVERELEALRSMRRSRQELREGLLNMAQNWERSKDARLKNEAAKTVSRAYGGLRVAPAQNARSGRLDYPNSEPNEL